MDDFGKMFHDEIARLVRDLAAKGADLATARVTFEESMDCTKIIVDAEPYYLDPLRLQALLRSGLSLVDAVRVWQPDRNSVIVIQKSVLPNDPDERARVLGDLLAAFKHLNGVVALVDDIADLNVFSPEDMARAGWVRSETAHASLAMADRAVGDEDAEREVSPWWGWEYKRGYNDGWEAAFNYIRTGDKGKK